MKTVNLRPLPVRLASALCALTLAGCGADETFELIGTWTSSFGGTEVITAERWGEAEVVDVDNDGNRAVLRNPETDMFAPGKFARVVWTEPAGDAFHYCWVDFGLDTRLEAETSTRTADPARPDATGCGGFAWTRLERQR
jgi:hypothetical protein